MNIEIAEEIKEYLIKNGDRKIYPDNLIAFTDFVENDRKKQLSIQGVVESFFCEAKYDEGGDGCKVECEACKNL